MAEGVDYSHARPDPGCMHRSGKRFVVRYIGTPNSGKNLTVAETSQLKAAGLDLAVVYETTAGFMLEGYARGQRAARESLADGAKYGLPTNRPIYYALDIDPNPLSGSQISQINAFLDGAASITGRSRVGIYAGFRGIELTVPGRAAFGWQTYAWSGGKVSTKGHLLQYKNGVNLCGGQVDLCRSLKPDFGQWGATPQEQPLQLDAEDQQFIQDQVQRLGDKLMLGISNPLFPPTRADITNPKLLLAVGQVADVDANAIAAAVVAALPSGAVDAAVVKAAVKEALREGTA